MLKSVICFVVSNKRLTFAVELKTRSNNNN